MVSSIKYQEKEMKYLSYIVIGILLCFGGAIGVELSTSNIVGLGFLTVSLVGIYVTYFGIQQLKEAQK